MDATVSLYSLKSHLYHTYRTVNYHLSCIYDSGSLLTLEHNCGNLGSVCKVGDSCFNNLDTCLIYSFLDLILYTISNDLAGTAKASVIGYTVTGCVYAGSYIVRIKSYYVTQRCVALKRKEFLVVVYVEYRLCSIYYSPCNSNTYLNRITKAVIDLLAA